MFNFSVKICNSTLRMKIAIVLLLTFSCLCDLEAQQQAEPLVPESKKTDIIIPTANPRPITVKLSNQVGSIQVDGHRIAASPLRHRVRRHLSTIHRRHPVVHRRAQDDEEIIETETESSNPSDDFYGEDEEVEEIGGDETGEEIGGDETGEEIGGYETGEETDEGEPIEEIDEGCEYTNYNDYEAALTCAFDNYGEDIEYILEEANTCLAGLSGEEGDASISEAPATEKVLSLDTVKACSGAFQSLQTIQELMRECSYSEEVEGDDNVEYVDEAGADEEGNLDEYYGDEQSDVVDENGNDEIAETNYDDTESYPDEIEDETVPAENGAVSEESEESPVEINQTTITEETLNNPETDQTTGGTSSEGNGSAPGSGEESKITSQEVNQRKRMRVMRIRRINRLRHLNALRRQRLIKAGRFRRVQRLVRGHPHRRVIIRRHLRGVPIRRRVIRPHTGHNLIVRPQLNGKRIVRHVIRRAGQRIVRPAGLNHRPVVNKFHRYA